MHEEEDLSSMPTTLPLQAQQHNSSPTNAHLNTQNTIAHNLNNHLIHHISTQIMQSKITISHQTSINVENSSLHPPRDHLKLSKIVLKKRQLNEQINRLQYEQSQLKQKEAKPVDRHFRSIITSDEIQKIKEVLRSQRQLSLKQENKSKRRQEQIRLKRMEEQQQQRQKIRRANQQKQTIILNNLHKLKQKQIQREKKIKSSNIHFQHVKNQSPLHQKMENEWRSQQQVVQGERAQALRVLRREKAFSMEQIKSHEEKYNRIRTQDLSSLKQKYIKQKNNKLKMELETFNSHRSSKFLQTLFHEENIRKKSEEERHLTMKALLDKKNNYGQTVLYKFRQSLIKRNDWDSIEECGRQMRVDEGKTKNYQSVSKEELAQLGNKYMREVHSSIDFVQLQKNVVKVGDEPIKPKDYLRQLRQRRKLLVQNPELRQIRQLKGVLRKKDSMEDKLYFAKMIANRMHERAGSDTKMLLSSINAKLAILDQFIKN